MTCIGIKKAHFRSCQINLQSSPPSLVHTELESQHILRNHLIRLNLFVFSSLLQLPLNAIDAIRIICNAPYVVLIEEEEERSFYSIYSSHTIFIII